MCTSIRINFLRIYVSQSSCSLGPKSFLRVFYPLKSLLRVSEHPPSPPSSTRAPSFVDTCYAYFFSDVYTWIMSFFYLDTIKLHETNLSAEKSNILWYPSVYKIVRV